MLALHLRLISPNSEFASSCSPNHTCTGSRTETTGASLRGTLHFYVKIQWRSFIGNGIQAVRPSFLVLTLHKGSSDPLCIDLAMLPSLRHLSIALEPMYSHSDVLGNIPEALDLAAPGNVIESVEIGIQLSVDNANRSLTCEPGKGLWMQLDARLTSTLKFRCLEKAEIILFLKRDRQSIANAERYRDLLMLQFPLLLERGCGVFRVVNCEGELYFFD